MKTPGLFVLCYAFCLLSGCATTHTATAPSTYNEPQNSDNVRAPIPQCPKKKNPMEVSFYSNGKSPETPYAIIGEAKIPEYNTVGIKKQEAIVHDALRKLAASMGGDAVIELKHRNKFIVGKVIAYEDKTIV